MPWVSVLRTGLTLMLCASLPSACLMLSWLSVMYHIGVVPLACGFKL